MISTIKPGYLRLISELERRVAPHFSSHHLDYYSGKYPWAGSITNHKPECQVLAFDPRWDTETWRTQSRRMAMKVLHALEALGAERKKDPNPNYTWTSDLNVVKGKAPFTSASAFFKFNTQLEKLFEGVLPLLAAEGVLSVIDYDLVGMSQEEFLTRFRAQAELDEIRTFGFEEAYRTYTRVGLENCIQIGEAHGLKTIERERFLGQYFIWVGANHSERK
ncbi:MAG: hypothetical protein AABX70_07200 [Nanoarchaeota archaeon]